jgi:hypothetical protein
MLPNLILNDKNFLKKFRRLFVVSGFILIFLTSFIYVYDVLYGKHFQKSFIDYLILETEGRGYLYRPNKDIQDIENDSPVGRIDSIKFAYKFLLKDTVQIFFGTGLGTAIPKKIKFLISDDKDLEKFNPGTSTVSVLFWEFGIFGIVLFFLIIFFVFKDSYQLSKKEGIEGAVGLSLACISIIMLPVSFYINIFYIDVINMPYWFLSGLVISWKSRLKI